MHRCRERRSLGTVLAHLRPRPLRPLNIGLGKVHAPKKKLSSGRSVTRSQTQSLKPKKHAACRETAAMHRCRERGSLGTVLAHLRPRPLRPLNIGLGKVHAPKKKLSSGRYSM